MDALGLYAGRGCKLRYTTPLLCAYLLECFAKTMQVCGLLIVPGNGKPPNCDADDCLQG